MSWPVLSPRAFNTRLMDGVRASSTMFLPVIAARIFATLFYLEQCKNSGDFSRSLDLPRRKSSETRKRSILGFYPWMPCASHSWLISANSSSGSVQQFSCHYGTGIYQEYKLPLLNSFSRKKLIDAAQASLSYSLCLVPQLNDLKHGLHTWIAPFMCALLRDTVHRFGK